MGPEGVVYPAPATNDQRPTTNEGLGLSHVGEQLGVQEFITEPDVERLGKAVLPQ